MSDNKCNYEIKGKYNGVWGYDNDSLTDKKAKKLIKDHPRGVELFAIYPKPTPKKTESNESKS